jgi:hypothetical protein
MILKQLSIPLENSLDRLSGITEAFGDAGINLRALNLVDTENFGLLRVLVSDHVTARRILMQKHIPARVEEVVVAELMDRPGELAGILKNLMDSGIKLRYAYPFAGSHSGKAVLVMCLSDHEKGIAVLQASGARLLDELAVGAMETAA